MAVILLQVEEEQSQQKQLALEKDKMATAFDNLKKLVEEDADTEAEYVKVMQVAHLIRTTIIQYRNPILWS